MPNTTSGAGRRSAKRAIPPGTLRTEAELDAAIEEINSLVDRQGSLSKAEEVHLTTLTDAVETYESAQESTPDLTPADQLRYLLDIHGKTTMQLAAKTGIRRDALEASLAGRRKLTVEEAKCLAIHFRLSPAAFRRPTARRTPILRKS